MGKNDTLLPDAKTVAFLHACAQGDIKAVKKSLDSRVFQVDADIDGVTGLHKACGAGHIEIVKLLVNAGAVQGWGGPTKDPHNALAWACEWGKLEIVQYFVEEIRIDVASINTLGGIHKTKSVCDYALSPTPTEGDFTEQDLANKFQVLSYLHAKGAAFGEGVKDKAGVFSAAAEGLADYVKWCIVSNKSLEKATFGKERSTLLHVAAFGDHFSLAKVLMTFNVEVDPRDAQRLTPLHLACSSGGSYVAKLLLDAGASYTHIDAIGRTALHVATEVNNLAACRVLLAAIPASETASAMAKRDKRGHTPVSLAFEGGVRMSLVRYLTNVLDGNIDPAGEARAEAAALKAIEDAKIAEEEAIKRAIEEKEAKKNKKKPKAEAPAPDTTTRPILSPEEAARIAAALNDNGSEFGDDTVDGAQEELGPATIPATVDPAVVEEAAVPEGKQPDLRGSKRLTRFLSATKAIAWGYTADSVQVIPREAFLLAEKLQSFVLAKLSTVTMSSIAEDATVLFLSHRWATDEEPDPSGETYAQAKQYLETTSEGQAINYIWVDFSCLPPQVEHDDPSLDPLPLVDYGTLRGNMLTALLRCNQFLAIPTSTEAPIDEAQKLSEEEEAAKLEAEAIALQEAADAAANAPPGSANTFGRKGSLASFRLRGAAAFRRTSSLDKEAAEAAEALRNQPQEEPPAPTEDVPPPPPEPEPEPAHKVLKDGLCSDYFDYLGRGWVEFECSAAAMCGLDVTVALRWGEQVGFCTAMYWKPSTTALPPPPEPVASDAATEQQSNGTAANGVEVPPVVIVPLGEPEGLGLLGACIGAAREAAPKVVEDNSFFTKIKRVFIKDDPITDPAVHIINVVKSQFEQAAGGRIIGTGGGRESEVLSSMVIAAAGLREDGAVGPVLGGTWRARDLLSKLPLSTLRDIKACFALPGPLGDESDRAPLSFMYIGLLSYLMGDFTYPEASALGPGIVHVPIPGEAPRPLHLETRALKAEIGVLTEEILSLKAQLADNGSNAPPMPVSIDSPPHSPPPPPRAASERRAKCSCIVS